MTETSGRHLLLVGLTTRALAQSAAAAGYRVTALDGFGDLDLRAVADVRVIQSTEGRFSATRAGALAERIESDLVAYTSNLENYPNIVTRLAAGRTLLGNTAPVLKRARNPIELSRVLQHYGLPCPRTRTTPPHASGSSWLLKRRRSGGGNGVSVWRRGMVVPRGSYLQEWVDGIPGSVVFAASTDGAVVLGVSRQLVGEAGLGARGFRYCGSLICHPTLALFPDQRRLLDQTAQLAMALTQELGLQGLNGIDFIARNGIPYPIEVNPRYSASMELVERATGFSLFGAHVRSCMGKKVQSPQPSIGVHGKAIVFARRHTIVGDTSAWLQSGWLADVPNSGERIRRGRPICTVFATAPGVAGCLRGLRRRANSVYRIVSLRGKRAA